MKERILELLNSNSEEDIVLGLRLVPDLEFIREYFTEHPNKKHYIHYRYKIKIEFDDHIIRLPIGDFALWGDRIRYINPDRAENLIKGYIIIDYR